VTPDSDSKLLRSLLPCLIIISMIGPLALNIIMPSLPGLEKALSSSRGEVQLALSLFLASQAVSQLFIGALADRYGRRPVLLVSLTLYCLASVAASFASSILLLVLARIVQAAGATAGVVIARSVVKDLAPQERAASMIGYVTAGMIVAPLMAPIIGGAVDDAFGWRVIFLVCLALGVFAFLLCYWQLPETRPEVMEGQSMGDVLRRSFKIVQNKQFLAYALGASFTSAVFFSFLGAAPYLVVETMKMSKLAYGLWFTSLSFGYLIGNFLAGRLSSRLGSHRMILFGNVIGLGGAALLLGFAVTMEMSPLTLFIPCLITSLGNGLLLPNAVAGAISVNSKATGTAAGVVGFLQMGLGAIASFVTGQITMGSPVPMATVMFAFALAGWIALGSGRRIQSL
jgi:MFS transporter, DHA1 family, multidrug resistance protein